MTVARQLPPLAGARPPRLVLVEGRRGSQRRRRLERWLDTAPADLRTVLVDCDFDRGGPWAGLKQLLELVVPEIEASDPALLARHAAELTLVVPRLSEKLAVSNLTLTELATPEEKTRNYPMDRAFRILHGVIDMIADAYRDDPRRWLIVWDDFDRAGALVTRFVRELLRRRGEALGLDLVVVGEELHDEAFRGPFERHRVLFDDEPAAEPIDPGAMRARAEEIETIVEGDDVQLRERLPELIYCWLHSDRPERAGEWQALAFGEYNHHGFYEDAARYGAQVMPQLDRVIGPDKLYTRWNLVGAMGNCLLALGRAEEALDIVRREGLEKITDHADLARVHYVLALIHSRFLEPVDLDLGERHIHRGLDHLAQSDLGENDRNFLNVFLLNGLAYIRHRQKRPLEALEICRRGFEHLGDRLPANQHRLHRSVLLYNVAQVQAALGHQEEAIEYLTAAIEMDPNYSEYFNERANAHLQQGRIETAIADYREAIHLSAPYQEVWTNLGQACKLAGRWSEAVEAYGRALDLEPDVVLALVGRAQAWEALGEDERAILDYDAALGLAPGQPLVLGNRAGLRYGRGDLAGALDDLDAAIRLAPGEADLRFNRGVLLAELGRSDEAAEELRHYLSLAPEAGDRGEVEQRLSRLETAA